MLVRSTIIWDHLGCTLYQTYPEPIKSINRWRNPNKYYTHTHTHTQEELITSCFKKSFKNNYMTDCFFGTLIETSSFTPIFSIIKWIVAAMNNCSRAWEINAIFLYQLLQQNMQKITVLQFNMNEHDPLLAELFNNEIFSLISRWMPWNIEIFALTVYFKHLEIQIQNRLNNLHLRNIWRKRFVWISDLY